MTAEEVRRILEELVTAALPHWRIIDVTPPIPQADRDAERCAVIFEMDR